MFRLSGSHLGWPGTLAYRQAGTRRGGPPRTSQRSTCLPHSVPALDPTHPSATCSNLLNSHTLARRLGMRHFDVEVHFQAVCRKHYFCLFLCFRISLPLYLFVSILSPISLCLAAVVSGLSPPSLQLCLCYSCTLRVFSLRWKALLSLAMCLHRTSSIM